MLLPHSFRIYHRHHDRIYSIVTNSYRLRTSAGYRTTNWRLRLSVSCWNVWFFCRNSAFSICFRTATTQSFDNEFVTSIWLSGLLESVVFFCSANHSFAQRFRLSMLTGIGAVNDAKGGFTRQKTIDKQKLFLTAWQTSHTFAHTFCGSTV